MLIPTLYFVISISLTHGNFKNQCLDTNFISKQKIDYDRLLTEISSYQAVECGVSGYKANKSEQWDRYDTLLQHSTDIQLYYFSNNSSPIIRVYAIKGLAKRKSPYLKEVLDIHKNDNAKFTYHCGCVSKTMPISLWIELVLSKEIFYDHYLSLHTTWVSCKSRADGRTIGSKSLINFGSGRTSNSRL